MLTNGLKTLTLSAVCTLMLAGLAPSSAKADWPERPIQIVVPFNAGGDTDFNARMYAKYLKDELGVATPVVNVSGSGGSIGARRVLDAKPDGQTVLFFHGAMLVNTASGIADFDWRDFELAAIAGREPGSVITVSGNAEWDSLEELMAASASRPGEINLTGNIGATTYLVAKLLNKAGGEFNIVDVGGSAKRLAAVLGGNVDVSQNPFGQVKQYLENGQLKGLATLRGDRNPHAPDVPTTQELGYDATFQYDYFFLFPKGTPQEHVDTFAAAVEKIATSNEGYANEIEAKYYQEPFFLKGDAARNRLEELEAVVNSVDLQ